MYSYLVSFCVTSCIKIANYKSIFFFIKIKQSKTNKNDKNPTKLFKKN